MPESERLAVETRHLVVATDHKFVVPTATTLRSVSLHDAGPFTVTVLASGVTTEQRRCIEQSVVSESFSFRWIDMTNANLGDTSRGLVGRATYFRLRLGELLEDAARALYIDTDVLVEAPLAPLWQRPRTAAVLSAVRSVNFPSICTYGAVDNWPELGLNPRGPYFNAGVLFVDLDRWRELDVGRLALDHLASPLANGALADQEALNVVLDGRWDELDPLWNVQPGLLASNRGVHLLYDDATIERARRFPIVTHFVDRPKPWHRDCTHPAAQRWRHVAESTAFGPIELDRTPITEQARWRVRRAASAIVKGR